MFWRKMHFFIWEFHRCPTPKDLITKRTPLPSVCHMNKMRYFICQIKDKTNQPNEKATHNQNSILLEYLSIHKKWDVLWKCHFDWRKTLKELLIMLKNKCRVMFFIQCKKKKSKKRMLLEEWSQERAIPTEETPNKVLTSFIILQCLLWAWATQYNSSGTHSLPSVWFGNNPTCRKNIFLSNCL